MLKELILLELAVVGVDDREGRAGRVGCSDGGDNNDGQVNGCGNSLGSIKDLTAAQAHHNVCAAVLKDGHQTVDLGLRALAVEVVVDQLDTRGGKAGVHALAKALDATGRYDDQGFVAVDLGVLAQAVKLAGALKVLAGANENACHG